MECGYPSRHVPDGGWGWMVTFASFVTNMLIDGVLFTYGIFFPEFLRYFGESKAKTQLLHSIMAGIHFGVGPAASVLMNKFGSRWVAGSGACIVSVGLFVSTFSPNLDVMILVYSIAGGVGSGLLYLPSIVIVGSYFNKRRAFATGIALCGSGVGVFAFAPLIEVLLETYGWHGTMWILSACILNGVVCSATYRPLGTKHTHDNIFAKTNSSKCCKQSSSPDKFLFDFSLLKSPTMLLYGVSCLFVMFGYFIPTNFLPVWASEVNLSSDDGAFLISFMGISNTVTRVLIGYVTDKPWANSLIINNTALLIGGVSTCFVPFYTTFVTLSIYAVVVGAVMASIICLRTILMAEMLGIHRLSSSFGLVGLSTGLSSFLGSPIAGALVDMSGSYNLAFYFGGITFGLGGLICFPLRRISEWEKSRNIKLRLSSTSDAQDGIECTTI